MGFREPTPPILPTPKTAKMSRDHHRDERHLGADPGRPPSLPPRPAGDPSQFHLPLQEQAYLPQDFAMHHANDSQSNQQQNSMTEVASLISNLDIKNEPTAPDVHEIPQHGPRKARSPAEPTKAVSTPLFTIRATGAPNEAITKCPETESIEYTAAWYRLPEVPDFLVCTRCHADRISSAPAALVSRFERIDLPTGRCRFWLPRILEALWPATIRSGDLTALRVYMQRRVVIPDCAGPGGVTLAVGTNSPTWYGLPQGWEGNPAGFLGCEACFEDRIEATTFSSAGHFVLCPYPQPIGETWVCDVSMQYIARALRRFGSGFLEDWPGFLNSVSRRMPLQPCRGQAVTGDSTRWFTPRRPIDDFAVCETCFLDKIALTEFESDYIPWMPPPAPVAAGPEAQLLFICDLGGSVSVQCALEAALARRDFDVFHTAATAITAATPCPVKPVPGQLWYVPTGVDGDSGGLHVCSACYAGILVPFGLAPHFEVTTVSTMPRPCDLNPAAPRFASWMASLDRATDTGVFAPVRRLAALPACIGPSAAPIQPAGSPWFGFPDAPICPACHEAVVVGSALEPLLALHGEPGDVPTPCCLYSPRMRRAWAEACCAGSPGTFVAAARHRALVYAQTAPTLQALRKAREIKMHKALLQGGFGVRWAAMSGFASGNDGYRYGNNAQGWSSTWEVANSNRLMNDMNSGMADAMTGSETQMIMQLEAMWKAVE